MSNDNLLRPSLTANGDVPALYSSQGFFFSAFFGGPLGAAAYGIANSHRLGRLKRELLPLLGAAVAGFLLCWALDEIGFLPWLAELMGGRERRNHEIFLRAIGLLTFGAIYLMHRSFYRATAVSGREPVSGWVPGIAAILLGAFANGVFLRWLLAHH